MKNRDRLCGEISDQLRELGMCWVFSFGTMWCFQLNVPNHHLSHFLAAPFVVNLTFSCPNDHGTDGTSASGRNNRIMERQRHNEGTDDSACL